MRDRDPLGLAQQRRGDAAVAMTDAVIIFAISARCGWFGGRLSKSVTVPIRLSPSKAPRTIRSPRPAAAKRRANASAAAMEADA